MDSAVTSRLACGLADLADVGTGGDAADHHDLPALGQVLGARLGQLAPGRDAEPGDFLAGRSVLPDPLAVDCHASADVTRILGFLPRLSMIIPNGRD